MKIFTIFKCLIRFLNLLFTILKFSQGLVRIVVINFRWQKWSCPTTRSLREDQALLLCRRLPLVPRAASPHGGNLVAAVNDIWVQPLDTCDVLELCVILIIRGSLAIRLGLCRCSASLTSVSQHGCLVFFGARLSCSPPWTYYCKKLTQNAQVVRKQAGFHG